VRRTRGFTLIEVLVALIIVAFGMGAVLSALSSSADNISALRDKTIAEWIAMNQIADTRLNLNAPQPGVTQGDIKDFGNGNWHWRQDVVAMDFPPGMLEIAVRVRRAKPGDSSSPSSGSSSGGSKSPSHSPSGLSSGAPSSFFGSSGGSSYSSGGFSSGSFSSGAYSSGLGPLSSSGTNLRNLGASKLPDSDKDEQWVVTVIGFRGDAIAPASGEAPDWNCNNLNSTLCGSASSGASSSSGAILPSVNPGVNPGTSGASGPVSGPIGTPIGSSGGP
jgi:general secretion pathway protein I